MKTLHKIDENYFTRVEDSTKADWEHIKKLISEGYVFVDKAAYKAEVKAVLSELSEPRSLHDEFPIGGAYHENVYDRTTSVTWEGNN